MKDLACAAGAAGPCRDLQAVETWWQAHDQRNTCGSVLAMGRRIRRSIPVQMGDAQGGWH